MDPVIVASLALRNLSGLLILISAIVVLFMIVWSKVSKKEQELKNKILNKVSYVIFGISIAAILLFLYAFWMIRD